MITHIRVKNCCGNAPLKGTVIEGNTFDKPLSGVGQPTNANAIDLDSNVLGLKVRFNSFPPGTYPSFTADQTDAQVTGNAIGALAGCISGVTYSYNVYVPWPEYQFAPCGPNDQKVTSLGYETGGFAPASGSPLIDYVPISVGCPPVDLNGTVRPQGAACDAGAVERVP
jgi:hypothetical protein